MKTIADVLSVARSHLHERVHRPTAPRRHYRKAADEELLPLIRRVVDERPTYGYRRVTALVNRLLTAEGKPTANHKRVFRIMKQQGLLLQRHSGRRKGRLHDGKVAVIRSNLRWCSDVFEILCWNGDMSVSSSSLMLTTARCLLGMRQPAPASAARWCAI